MEYVRLNKLITSQLTVRFGQIACGQIDCEDHSDYQDAEQESAHAVLSANTLPQISTGIGIEK